MYVDDLSDYLVKCEVRCHMDNVCVNPVMYADDICLMAPSPVALQKLINIGYDGIIYCLTLPSQFAWRLKLDCITYRVLRFI